MNATPRTLARQDGWGAGAITTRIGPATLPLGVVLIAISEVYHPSREDPMDFPPVFREYARSDVWTTVHLGEYFGFLLLLGGLVALYYSVRARPGVGAARSYRSGKDSPTNAATLGNRAGRRSVAEASDYFRRS